MLHNKTFSNRLCCHLIKICSAEEKWRIITFPQVNKIPKFLFTFSRNNVDKLYNIL